MVYPTIPIRPVLKPAEPPAPEPLFILPPLSLYVHFPWCVRKCLYCDFNSHALKTGLDETGYLTALMADLEAALPHIWGRRIVSVFIGGGTPSLLSPTTVDDLLAGLRQRLPIQPDAEITLEANPGAIEAEKFAGFKNAGITRLSLGIQSFDSRFLSALGRIHDGNEARRAAEQALTHFENVNFDLMYGLPGQSPEEADNDVRTALGFGPKHLSVYQLTLEPETPFFTRPPPDLPDDDTAAAAGERIEELLESAGWQHYETSAFARPDYQCRHNLNYWQFGDYLGIGPGAHSKISNAENIVRQVRWKMPERWLQAARQVADQPDAFIQEEKAVNADERPFEFVMNTLRLTQGFAPGLFHERTGLPLARIIATIRQAVDDGLLDMSDARIRPTTRGRRYLNELLRRFL